MMTENSRHSFVLAACSRAALIALCLLFLFKARAALAQDGFLEMPDPPAASSNGSGSLLSIIASGMLLGFLGQVARVIVGLKKEMDVNRQGNAPKKWREWFDLYEFLVSLLIGSTAGGFAALGLMRNGTGNQFIVACIGAGYSGADFIQGFMSKNNIPAQSTPPEMKVPTTSGPEQVAKTALPAS
jgi:hypothetical protein